MYEGISDPEKHLNNYKTYMNVRDVSWALKCRAFYLTLSEVGEIWYRNTSREY